MHHWVIRNRSMQWGRRPLILGIVNVTPDSFSDGGNWDNPEQAVERALRLVDEGADFLDIGGESTRPGAQPVPLEEERKRVIPVVEHLTRRTSVPISVDTYKAETARLALQAGASAINDVTGLCNAEMVQVIREAKAGVIVMHMQGDPQTMQTAPCYQNVVAEIDEFFKERLQALQSSGIDPLQVVLDPGIGFGKTDEHNWDILRHLGRFQHHRRPVCLGVSRKGLLGRLLDRPVAQRTIGSVAIACHTAETQTAQLVRVHDVRETRDALKAIEKLMG